MRQKTEISSSCIYSSSVNCSSFSSSSHVSCSSLDKTLFSSSQVKTSQLTVKSRKKDVVVNKVVNNCSHSSEGNYDSFTNTTSQLLNNTSQSLNTTSQSVQCNVEDPNLSSDIEISTDNESDYSGESMNSVSNNTLSSQSEVNETHSTVSFSLEDKRWLKCLYTNADSIANKWSELEALVYIYQPDIIGLTKAFSKSSDNILCQIIVWMGLISHFVVQTLGTKEIEVHCCSFGMGLKLTSTRI